MTITIKKDQIFLATIVALMMLYLLAYLLYPKQGNIFLYDKVLHFGLGFVVVFIVMTQSKNQNLPLALFIILVVELFRSGLVEGGMSALFDNLQTPNEFLDFVFSGIGAIAGILITKDI